MQSGTTNPPNPTYVSIFPVQNNPDREIGSMSAAILVLLRQISLADFLDRSKTLRRELRSNSSKKPSLKYSLNTAAS